jgi:ATP-dependent Clp protease ATP-binding subunit ClpC
LKALKKKFRPEFNRIDEAIILILTEQDIHKIIYVEIAKLENRLKDMKFKLKINKSANGFQTEGYDELYGARPLTRAIQHYVEDPIADEILNGSLKKVILLTLPSIKTKKKLLLKVLNQND